MKLDIKDIDTWLLNNWNYTQEDRELIVDCLFNYIEDKEA